MKKQITVWRHNGRRNTIKMAQVNLRAIINADTTSEPARETAIEALTLLIKLHAQLKTRIDQ